MTPTATSAADVVYAAYGEQGNTIVRWTDVDEGGHFAALEQPDSLVADLRAFVRELGPA